MHEREYHTREEAQAEVFEFIEVFYNRQRLYQTLGYVNPVQFETTHVLNLVSMKSGVAHSGFPE